MRRFTNIVVSMAIFVGVTACCCPLQFGPGVPAPGGPGPAPIPGPGGDGPIGKVPDDPAEKAAVDAIKATGGFVKQEGGRVVEVSMFQPSVNNDTLKDFSTLAKTRKISITQSKVTGAGLRFLAGLKELEHLDLGGSRDIDASGVKDIAQMKQLKYLGLRGTKIGDTDLPALAPLTQLEELDVGGFTMSNTAGVNIVRHLRNLKKLKIDNSDFGDVGAMALADHPSLQYLQMFGTQVTDLGFAALPKLKTLEHLSVGTRITDSGMKSIASCKNLRYFSVFNSNVSDKGLKALEGHPNLKEVEIRNGVFGTISNAGIASLIKANPNCSVKGP